MISLGHLATEKYCKGGFAWVILPLPNAEGFALVQPTHLGSQKRSPDSALLECGQLATLPGGRKRRFNMFIKPE